MSKCRACKMPKWRGDICSNADCKRAVSPAYRLTSKLGSRPVTAMVRHGFHAEYVMRKGA